MINTTQHNTTHTTRKSSKLGIILTAALFCSLLAGCGNEQNTAAEAGAPNTMDAGTETDGIEADVSRVQSPEMSIMEFAATLDTEVPQVIIWNGVLKEGRGTVVKNGERVELTDGDLITLAAKEPIEYADFSSDICKQQDAFEEGRIFVFAGLGSDIELEKEEMITIKGKVGNEIYRKSFIVTKPGFEEQDWDYIDEQEIYAGDLGNITALFVENNGRRIDFSLEIRDQTGKIVDSDSAGIAGDMLIDGVEVPTFLGTTTSISETDGTTFDDSMQVSVNALKAAGISRMQEIAMKFCRRDEDITDGVWEEASVIKTAAYGGDNCRTEIPGEVIYDADGIKIWVSAYADDFRPEWGQLYIYAENSTDQDVLMNFTSVQGKGQELLTYTDDGVKMDGFHILEKGSKVVADQSLGVMDGVPSGLESLFVELQISPPGKTHTVLGQNSVEVKIE